MAYFRVTCRREVKSIDEFDDYIEAETPEQAQEIAKAIAWRANGDCPDWAKEVEHDYLDDWKVETLEPITSIPDEFYAETIDLLSTL